MDIAQLRTLVRVSELGSLNKAADRLRVAQPALSRQIKLLEEELNTRLFVRHGRGMALTAAGEKVLVHALSIMREMEAIRSDVELDRTDVEGRVVMGLPPTVAEIVMVPFYEEIKSRYPRLRVHITPAFCGHLLEWLHRGDIDLAVLYNTKPFRSLRTRPLVDERLFVVGSVGKAYDPMRPITFAEVAERPLILPGLKHSLRMLIEQVAREAGISLDIRYEIESLGIIRDLVKADQGVTILPFSAVYADLDASRLTAAPIVEPVIMRKLIIACASDRMLVRTTEICESTLARIVKQLRKQGSWPTP